MGFFVGMVAGGALVWMYKDGKFDNWMAWGSGVGAAAVEWFDALKGLVG